MPTPRRRAYIFPAISISSYLMRNVDVFAHVKE
jgi:hypothetical protein